MPRQVRKKADEKQKTGTAVAKASQTTEPALANLEQDVYSQYGASVSFTAIVGQLLKFNKGDWLVGEGEEELAEGSKLVFDMDQLLIGWVKWVDNKPIEQLMGLLKDNFRPAKRHELGDTDESQWDTDAQGKPRDPWQFTNYLIGKEPGKSDDLYTFATSSRGGIGAVGNLCKAYGKEMRQRPDENPIVELGVDSYKHSNPEFGRIKVPVLKLVGWEKKSLFVKPVAEAA